MKPELHGCGHCAGIGPARPKPPTLAELLPRVLPPGWTERSVELPPSGVPAVEYTIRFPRPLVVFVTLDDGEDEIGLWLHSSTSRRGRLPSWNDLKLVHQVVHQDRPVVQVLPPRSSWLSIADCLHLFERLDAPTIPEGLWRR